MNKSAKDTARSISGDLFKLAGEISGSEDARRAWERAGLIDAMQGFGERTPEGSLRTAARAFSALGRELTPPPQQLDPPRGARPHCSVCFDRRATHIRDRDSRPVCSICRHSNLIDDRVAGDSFELIQ